MASIIPLICRLTAHIIGLLDFAVGLARTLHLPKKLEMVYSVPVDAVPDAGEGECRRSPISVARPLNVAVLMDFDTFPGLLDYCLQHYRFRLAVTWRPIIGPSKDIGGVVTLGRSRVLTYEQFYDKVLHLAAGLRALGLQPGDVVAFHEDTCVEWMLLCCAAWQNSMTITTIYASLGAAALEFALRQTHAAALFTAGPTARAMAPHAALPALRALLCREMAEAVQDSSRKVLSITDLEELGRQQPCRPNPPRGDDLACIMYTSGTTGDPKGVLLTHRNLTVSLVAMVDRIGQGRDQCGKTLLSFLPLAHIYSLVTTFCWLFAGGLLCIGSPATLTDMAAKPHGDLREFRPHVLPSVPRVYDLIRKSVQAKLCRASPLALAMFNTAFANRLQALQSGRPTPVWDRLVFNKIRDAFGGRLETAYAGGAPMGCETQDFVRVVLDAHVGQGYGLTETTACLAVQLRGDISNGNVGAVHDPCEVKLVDLPDMGYTSRDCPYPRGEIWVRGANVSPGYYKMPELTAEVFKPGGWFATGDVGQWLPSGALQLIDRKKNLVKLAMGEYVALEKLESIYSSISMIQPNGICCVAHPEKTFVVALIAVQPEALRSAAHLPPALPLAALLTAPNAHRAVHDALAKVANAHRLQPFEQIKRFKLCTDVWSLETGMLTPAQKLLRRKVEEHYKADIAALYA